MAGRSTTVPRRGRRSPRHTRLHDIPLGLDMCCRPRYVLQTQVCAADPGMCRGIPVFGLDRAFAAVGNVQRANGGRGGGERRRPGPTLPDTETTND